MVTVSRWPLIGRETIVARATELLDSGSGGVVLVGEAGVGKSRIAAHVVETGRDRGYTTASTVGTQAAADIPLGALSHLLPDLGTPGVNVLAAARRALAERAGNGRLMLSIDDAHLLDNHSAALVLQLALTVPSFVVATIRVGAPVPDSVVSLWKDGLAERVDVGPLDDRAIAEIVAHVLGGPVDPLLSSTIAGRADGNPLVARELCFGGVESGAIDRRGGTWQLVGSISPSARLVELVAARVEGLDADQRRALNVVAHGEPLSFDAALELASRDELLELERRGLVALREDGRRREVWLSHPFYGDVVRATAGAMLAASIKGSLAQATRAAGMRRGMDVIRVATWQLEAGNPDPQLLLAAARETYRARDMASTARLAAGAWDVRPDAESGFLFAAAVGYSGRHVEADAIFSAAAGLATNDEDRARLAVGHSAVLSAGLGKPRDAIALLEGEDGRIHDDLARTMIRAQRAHLLSYHGSIREALELAEPITRATHGPPLIVAAMASLIAYASNGCYYAAVELAERVLPEHRSLWATGTVVLPPELLELQAAAARVALGDLDAVRLPADGLGSRAESVASNRPVVVLRAVHAAAAAIVRGKPRTAERILAAAGVTAFDPLASAAEATFALAAALTGRADEATAAFQRAEVLDRQANRTSNFVVDQARVWTWVARGRPHDARRAARDAMRANVQARTWGLALGFGHDLARLGQPAEAAASLAQVAGHVDGPLAATKWTHIEALAAKDTTALDRASHTFESIGASLFAAEAAADAGRAARRGGDPRRSTALFRRAAALAADCEGAATPALVMPDELTPLSPREREIASLAATGLRSDEIAERLFLSVRTVDNHLQHVYQKLGIASRSQLAVAMGRHEG